MSGDVQSEEEEGCGSKEKGYQFIMELLLRVMKKTWLLPPERTEAKNTCREQTAALTSLMTDKGFPFKILVYMMQFFFTY